MFSYPSEKKLHIGHWWNYGGTDTYARFRRMQGDIVFEPMGFDAFGLPAENYAVKHGVHPAATTRDSINYIREQLKLIGAMYDWNYEVDTSRPEYYRWTQWLFLQLYRKGAAYRKQAPVNWCPSCMTVLANEQVQSDGTCERCSSKVTTRNLEQWFFRITDFADQLLEGLDRIDWPASTKARQRNWIGRSEGSEIDFELQCQDLSSEHIVAFTTRPDTLFGVSYVVLAPEHHLLERIVTPEHRPVVSAYVERSRHASEIERLSTEREKTGVFTGAFAIHPLTGEPVPIWVADYVIGSYGTGAVMAVPAHDQRDFDFATRYGLPIRRVIRPENPHDDVLIDRAFVEPGVLQNSGAFDGQTSELASRVITDTLIEQGRGRFAVSYRLRDWLVSRQRYWGAPIPMIHCSQCGVVEVPESDLPVLLPEDIVDFAPRGASPLGAHKSFIETTCPRCHGAAQRDPDTMDTFVDSSWYFLRYPSTDVNEHPFNMERTKRWLPVDVYIGGPEHATGHLIYARYIAKFLHSQGLIDFDEPFMKMVHQGIITYNGQRMSKSKGNVVNPDAFIDKFGSDCFRLYLMFMGDWQTGGDWSDDGIVGVRRFQNKVWRLFQGIITDMPYNAQVKHIDRGLNRALNHTINEVSSDLTVFRFNTAISRLMELTSAIQEYASDPAAIDPGYLRSVLDSFTIMLSPFAPHMAEALWSRLGHDDLVLDQAWPEFDPKAIINEQVTMAVQINGKLVETVTVDIDATQEAVVAQAEGMPRVKRVMTGRSIRKTIFVPGKIVNFVV